MGQVYYITSQSEPLLPLPLGLGTHQRRLYELMGSFGPAGPRGKTQAALTPLQQPREPDRFRTSKR